jgi:hypothetical protein
VPNWVRFEAAGAKTHTSAQGPIVLGPASSWANLSWSQC